MSEIEATPASDRLIADVEAYGRRMAAVRRNIGAAIFGQHDVIELALIAIFSGGHALLVGYPGLGKTLLVETLGTILGLEARRVQFTPDLMPPDILGSEVLEESETGRRSFRFIRGPVFSQVLMADEINRASPRTQSALLQAMQEYKVSVAGQDHALPAPFHVLATQNPIELEGTYPLPEAQLDRFLLQIDVGYPDAEAEKRMLVATTGIEESRVEQVLTAADLIAAQRLVRTIPIGDAVVDAILELVRAARPDETADPAIRSNLSWGPGPRASQALALASKARALLAGRFSPSVDDVVAVAPSVLRHRIALTFSARADGITVDDIIGRLCALLA